MQTLKTVKRYFKGDYRLHISDSSECADHCLTYALSDPKNPEFSQTCDHSYTVACNSCMEIEQLASKLMEAVEERSESFSADEKDDFTHDISTAMKDIKAWKSHIL